MYKYKFTKFKFDMYLYPPRKLIRVQGGCCWKGAEWYGGGAGERGMHDPMFTAVDRSADLASPFYLKL